MSVIRVVVGLGEPMVLRGVEAILGDADDCEVAAAVVGAGALARAVDELKPDVAVAEELGIREQTVKNHLNRVMKKVDVSNRVELALLATREHLAN